MARTNAFVAFADHLQQANALAAAQIAAVNNDQGSSSVGFSEIDLQVQRRKLDLDEQMVDLMYYKLSERVEPEMMTALQQRLQDLKQARVENRFEDVLQQENAEELDHNQQANESENEQE